jgi:iron complex transport system substrate-binding protein
MRKRAASRSAVWILLLTLGCARQHADIPSHIARVVTLAPNLTEIVYAIGAGGRLVGTDDFSDDPPAAKSLPKVGGVEPNIEKIVTLRPDLVLATASRNDAKLARALTVVHIPLHVVTTDRLGDIPKAMERIGDLLHAGGRDAAAKLRTEIAAQRRTRARRPRVLFAVWADPLYVAGRETFSDDLFVLTGAENAVHARGWPQYSLESLVANPPDIILYPEGPVSRAQIEKLLKRRGTIIGVDDNLFTRPGPRVAEAAAELNRIFDRWERAR